MPSTSEGARAVLSSAQPPEGELHAQFRVTDGYELIAEKSTSLLPRIWFFSLLFGFIAGVVAASL